MKKVKVTAYNSVDSWEQTIEIKQNTYENVVANLVRSFFMYHKMMRDINVKVFKSTEPILMRFEAENLNVDLGLLSWKAQNQLKLQNNYRSRVRFHAYLLRVTKFIIEQSLLKPIATKDVLDEIEAMG